MSMKRKLVALALASAMAKEVHATHIIGGELYYDALGNGLYQVTLKLYRDCSGIAFDPTAAIGVFDGAGGGLLSVQTLSFPGGSFVPITLDSPCLTLPPDVCVETTSYTGLFNLPASPNGYILSYQRCCRTAIIGNLVDPGDLGLTVMTRIPAQPIESNSAPRFNELPPVALCLDAPLSFDHGASDPDGDSLVYSLCTPYNGGTALAPQPNPPAPPPYAPLPWSAGYSEGYPIDSDPAIAIDPATGLLTLTPTLQGNYTVGVMVQEYRNGALINETRRDFLFKVVACDAVVTGGIQPQSEFCTSLTVPFASATAGAQAVHWDFGVPEQTSDTSNAWNPVWTYAEPGTYTVTLIANPGTTCADTAQSVFNVYLAPQPMVRVPPPFCGNQPVTLVAEGAFGPQAALTWLLGSGSVPQTSSDSIVQVQFAGPGVHEVSLLVAENGCTAFVTETITNYALPEASFEADPDPPQLVGTPVVFTDTSDPNGGVIAQWDWLRDGSVFAPSAPTAAWSAGWPATYIIELIITTEDGCSDTASLAYAVEGGAVVVPNVFSPNGDGVNEAFVIPNIEYYPNELSIYSRWGTKVYEARNYRSQWTGDDVPEGTYYYVLVLEDRREYTGHVTILR